MKRARRNHGVVFKAQVAFAARTADFAGSALPCLTYDQGPEMREYRLFMKQTKMRVSFARPHCSWERGTNENANGLLREFFPKGTRFTRMSRTEIKQVRVVFTARPRNVLN